MVDAFNAYVKLESTINKTVCLNVNLILRRRSSKPVSVCLHKVFFMMNKQLYTLKFDRFSNNKLNTFQTHAGKLESIAIVSFGSDKGIWPDRYFAKN